MKRLIVVEIDGKRYDVSKQTPRSMAEFVMDVEGKNMDIAALCKKYGVTEAK